MRASTNYALAYAAIRLDRHLGGKPYREATAEELENYLANYIDGDGEEKRDGRTESIHMGVILRHAHGLDERRDLDRDIRRAIYVAKQAFKPKGVVIPDTEFLAAIEAVPRLTYTAGHASPLIRAALWTLFDAGFRISEMLSLRVSDCRFDDSDGTATLSLREELAETEGLKTGAGEGVIVTDAVPALKAWLEVHPWAHEGEAPLFTALGFFRHPRKLNDDVLNDVIREVFALVGGRPKGARTHYTAHDFRHTSATRYAESGATDSDLRDRYRWSATSPLPAWYVHQREKRRRERALATARVGSAPTLAAPAPVAVAAQTVQRIVTADELEGRMASGWRFLGAIGDGRFVVAVVQ
ncbi:MAG TPA: site-specific integrase [Candidatus Thermoplasmatota archaeon]|nr:site-specific integrase [Candidatus Thermoplasmatota archaeon]